MNVHLKESVARAEEVLPDEKLELLARMIDTLIADAGSGDDAALSKEELAELDAQLAKPFERADPAKVRALYERNGVSPRYDL